MIYLNYCTTALQVAVLSNTTDTSCGSSGTSAVLFVGDWQRSPGSFAVVRPDPALPTDLDGLFSLRTRCIDAAGNMGSASELQWWVDSVPPPPPGPLAMKVLAAFQKHVTFGGLLSLYRCCGKEHADDVIVAVFAL